MYRKILIPVDGSNFSAEAAEHGFRLAQEDKADLVLVTVLQLEPMYPVPTGGYAYRRRLTRAQRAAGKALLASLASQAELLGLRVRGIMHHGDPAEVILQVAADEEVDLIVMAAHPHGRLASLLLNSTSQEILRRAPCPVMIYGDGARQQEPVLP